MNIQREKHYKKKDTEVALPLPSYPELEERWESERCLQTPPLPCLLLSRSRQLCRQRTPGEDAWLRGDTGHWSHIILLLLTAAHSFLGRKFSCGTCSLLQHSQQTRPTSVCIFSTIFPPSPSWGAENLHRSKPTNVSQFFFLSFASL